MSALYKSLFAIVVVLCVMQFVELAPEERFRRDEPKEADNAGMKFLSDLQAQFQEAMKDENLQKFLNSASNVISEGAKAVEGQLKEWQEKVTEKKD